MPGVWGCGMGTATVLVVDDERKIRDTVRAFLERQHYAVLVAASGHEALDLASAASQGWGGAWAGPAGEGMAVACRPGLGDGLWNVWVRRI
jgi:hypothetical protein